MNGSRKKDKSLLPKNLKSRELSERKAEQAKSQMENETYKTRVLIVEEVIKTNL